MYSQFFVLSLRGDTILHKDCKYLITNTSYSLIVRKDLEVVKHTAYNSTQEMFLA